MGVGGGRGEGLPTGWVQRESSRTTNEAWSPPAPQVGVGGEVLPAECRELKLPGPRVKDEDPWDLRWGVGVTGAANRVQRETLPTTRVKGEAHTTSGGGGRAGEQTQGLPEGCRER